MNIPGYIITKNTEKAFVDNAGEWINDMTKAFKIQTYFKNVWCHVQSIDDLMDNTCYVFCSTEKTIVVKPYDNIDLPIKPLNNAWDGGFDMSNLLLTVRNNGDDVFAYTYHHPTAGNVYLAYYFPQRNILWLADFSHTSDFKRFKPIWDFLVEKHLKPYQETTEIKNVVITLGADPEFEVINDGLITMCPITVTKGKWAETRLTEKIGADGARTQLELRPDPADSPQGLVDNITKLFKEVNHYHLSDKGNGYPIGGHIHLGIKPMSGLPKILPTSSGILTLLDYFIGRPFKPLNGSARGHYIELGQTRPQPYGFEYRTPPAMIFNNPTICYIVLKIAYTLAMKHYNNLAIDIGTKVTGKELKDICDLTTEEVEYFYNFITNFDSENYEENIVTNWVEKYTNPLTIEFYDIWHQDVKFKLTSELKYLKVPAPVKIILYGLSQKKWGVNFAGFSTNVYTKKDGLAISHPAGCPHVNNGIAFGLPMAERAYPTRDGRGIYGVEWVIEHIKQVINNIDWNRFLNDMPVTSAKLGVH